MDDEESVKPEKVVAPKKGLPGIVLMLGAIIATGASAAAGAVLGPALAGNKAQAGVHGAAPAASSAGEEADTPGEAAALEPIVVDVREANGELHHLKVGIAIELGHGVTEEQFKHLVPRMRDAAISYLRALPFDEITTPAKFDAIRTELGEQIAHAAGKDKVRRVLFTDFVAQ
jgi:flagellar basal body-associated protein FliL